MALEYILHNNVFLLFFAKVLFKPCIVTKMLDCCTSFSVQIIFNNGFQIHSPLQCFSLVLGKRFVKTMHYHKKCLTAVVLVFNLYLAIAFKGTFHNNVFLLFSIKRLLKLCILIKTAYLLILF